MSKYILKSIDPLREMATIFGWSDANPRLRHLPHSYSFNKDWYDIARAEGLTLSESVTLARQSEVYAFNLFSRGIPIPRVIEIPQYNAQTGELIATIKFPTTAAMRCEK